MKTLCNKCGIIWAALWTDTDSKGEEDYEYCPLCRTDIHLMQVESNEKSFVMCKMTGKITELKSGEQIVIQNNVTLKPRKYIVYDETWKGWMARKEKREDDLIDKYKELLPVYGDQLARKMAHEQIPVIERKHHFE